MQLFVAHHMLLPQEYGALMYDVVQHFHEKAHDLHVCRE